MNRYISKIIRLYTQGKVDGSAKEEFHSWLVNDQSPGEKEEALYALWTNTENKPDESTLRSLEAVKEKLRSSREKKPVLAVWRYAAAIVFAICLVAAYIFTHRSRPEISFIEHYSRAGEPATFRLPDGSEVQTNSKTVLLYPESFGKDTRTLYLSGQANFKVVKNAGLPFVVKVKDFSVTALGTEFDVDAYPEDPYSKTTLIRGSIKVRQKNKEEVVLRANDQFRYHKQTGGASVSQTDIYDALAWQRGELIFRGTDIKEILGVLERRFGVSFQYRSGTFNNDKFNFRFKKGSALPEIMSIIQNVAGDFKYKVIDDVYYISPRGK